MEAERNDKVKAKDAHRKLKEAGETRKRAVKAVRSEERQLAAQAKKAALNIERLKMVERLQVAQ